MKRSAEMLHSLALNVIMGSDSTQFSRWNRKVLAIKSYQTHSIQIVQHFIHSVS